MIIISAMTRRRVIGSGAGMPWSVPEEYRQFLAFIEGQTVIMGRRSYEIFGPDLSSAHNIVVSRSASEIAGALVCPSVEAAVEAAADFGATVFSAGGASIYRQTMPLAEALYLSYIKGDYQGDVYFPEFDVRDWEVEKREEHPRFTFVIYRRRA